MSRKYKRAANSRADEYGCSHGGHGHSNRSLPLVISQILQASSILSQVATAIPVKRQSPEEKAKEGQKAGERKDPAGLQDIRADMPHFARGLGQQQKGINTSEALTTSGMPGMGRLRITRPPTSHVIINIRKNIQIEARACM